jgi:hypothetical protein
MVWLTAVHALLWLAYASVLGGLLAALLRGWRWVTRLFAAGGLLGLTHALCAMAMAAVFAWQPELIVGQVDASVLPALRRSMADAARVMLHSALFGAGVGLAGLGIAWLAHRKLLRHEEARPVRTL